MSARVVYGWLALLARNAGWLAFGASLATLVALVVLLREPPAFVATVEVVPRRARTVVNLDTRIQRVSDDTAPQGLGLDGQPVYGLSTASAERRQALARLVRTPDVARAVREQLKDELPPALHDLRQLMSTVRGAVPPRTEMITIAVTAPSAALAERIAQAWAQAYERHVNTLYAASEVDTTQLEGELARAKTTYEAAQGAVTRFEGTSRLDEYKRQAEARTDTLQHLSKGVLQEKAKRLSALYDAAQRIDLLTADAEALQQQLEAAPPQGSVAGTEVALTLLTAQAFASSSPLPANLQLQLPAAGAPANAGGAAAEAASLVRVLRSWSGAVGQEIKSRLLELQLPEGIGAEDARQALAAHGAGSADLRRLHEILQASHAGDLAEAVARLEQDVRALQGTVADLTAQQKSLQQQRDLTRDSYTSLLKKTEEARLAGAVGAGREITVASRTVVAEPLARNLPAVLSLAALLGATAAAATVLLQRWSLEVRQGLAWTQRATDTVPHPEDASLRSAP